MSGETAPEQLAVPQTPGERQRVLSVVPDIVEPKGLNDAPTMTRWCQIIQEARQMFIDRGLDPIELEKIDGGYW